MILAFRDRYSLPCIAGTQSGRDCGRDGAGQWLDPTEGLADGRQPVCWQHRGALEEQLQRIALGIDVPTTEVDPLRLYLGPGVAHHAEGCRAFVDHELNRCRAKAVMVTSAWGHIVLALCDDHLAALTTHFKAEWTESAPHVAWGWQVARDHGRVGSAAVSPTEGRLLAFSRRGLRD